MHRESSRVSWDEGVALAHDLARQGLAFHPREDRAAVAYRDDNRYPWEFDEAEALAGAAPWQDRQVRRRVRLMEFVNEVGVEGARKAVEALGRSGVATFCVSLDPAAADYVSRIFGAGRYAVVDRVERLPGRLPALALGLLR